MHRYILEPYSGTDSRFMCPNCRHRRDTFKRYIDTRTQTYLADHVGRCDRQEQCGYHYPPRQYFADNPGLVSTNNMQPGNCEPPIENFALSWSLVEQTLKAYHRNNFVLFLAKMFGEEKTKEAVLKYGIGTSSHWPGASVFWQLDYHEQVHAGKVMLYNVHTGKRVKQPYNHITWVHTLLNQNLGVRQCLFGEHLLSENPDGVVAITESEKTAVIGSIMEPGFVWLAAGSLEGLSLAKCKILQYSKVLLFPDVNGYDKWRMKAREIRLRYPAGSFKVDNTLKLTATEYERQQGIDIADRWIEQLKPKQQ